MARPLLIDSLENAPIKELKGEITNCERKSKFHRQDRQIEQAGSEPHFEATSSGVSRRELFNVGLAAAAQLTLTGCATFGGSKSDLDQATTDLRNLLESFEGEGARQARLASIGRRIENRCREVIELKFDFTQRLRDIIRCSRFISFFLDQPVGWSAGDGETQSACGGLYPTYILPVLLKNAKPNKSGNS